MFIPILKQRNYQLLTGAWAAVITIVSGIPNLQINSVKGIPQIDKVVHIVIFAILAYLLAGALNRYIKSWKVVTKILLVFILITLFGYIDELHQSTVVGRNSSLRDLFADGIGAFIGTIIYQYIHNKHIELR